MADFAEVWKQWKRMCWAVKGNGDRSCVGCELCNLECDSEFPKDQNYYDGKTIEAIIMSWAAEHPEPVYPTWCEWLNENGVILNARMYGSDKDWMLGINALQPIPADIAEKLGVQPKGEDRGT